MRMRIRNATSSSCVAVCRAELCLDVAVHFERRDYSNVIPRGLQSNPCVFGGFVWYINKNTEAKQIRPGNLSQAVTHVAAEAEQVLGQVQTCRY